MEIQSAASLANTQVEPGTTTVLVVDDDATMRILMRHTLKKAGFDIMEASNGQMALQKFKQQRPDIILLDVMMPEMDGYTVCQALRQLPGGQHVPVLMVTGLDDVESIDKAYEAGATDFITKPITFPLLSYRVRYALRASQAMENIGKSEARLAHAQAIAHLGNWEWDVERDKFFCSEEIFHILQTTRARFKPSYAGFLEFVHPDDLDVAKGNLDQALQHAVDGCSLDYRILPTEGEVRIVHLQLEVVTNAEGQAIQLNGTLQDITERKKVENELKQYRSHLEDLVEQRTAELKATNSALLVAKDQAEKANELKDKFLSLVAHDLRSPLAGIISALEYMHTDDEEPLNEEHQEIVGRLLQIGKSAVHMIEDVLNIGRLKTGKLTPNARFLNAHKKVEKVINNLSYLAKQKGVALLNEVSEDVVVYADPSLLGEVIQNLASNAIKFCQKGEKVRFYTPNDADKPNAAIAVEDDGTGIPTDKLPKLFRVEERTSTTGTAGEKGTGFGLPFSQDIMHAHDGELTVESTLGKGTTFFINLPSVTPKALLLSQDAQALQPLQTLLSEQQFELSEVSDMSQAVQYVEETHPHLVLCDTTMLNGNLSEQLAGFKSHIDNKHLGLMLINDGSTIEEPVLTQAGVIAVLSKPFGNETRAQIKAFFHR